MSQCGPVLCLLPLYITLVGAEVNHGVGYLLHSHSFQVDYQFSHTTTLIQAPVIAGFIKRKTCLEEFDLDYYAKGLSHDI